MTAAVTPLNEAQIELLPSLQAIHKGNGERIRLLLAQTMERNRIGRSDLAAETGYDSSELTKFLDPHAGRNVPVAVIAAVMARDTLGVFITGLAAMVRYEATPKRPDLAAENRRLREELGELRSRITSLLGEP